MGQCLIQKRFLINNYLIAFGRISPILLGVYCGLIYYLSSQSSLPIEPLFLHQDKLIHAAAYAVMGLLAYTLLRHYFRLRYIGFLAWIFCVLYGLSDEWHQSFVAGRDADALDWLADSVGAGLMIYALNYWLANQAI